MSTTNILDLNNRVNALEKAVSGGNSAQVNKKDIATEFSATTAYTAGCFVYYQGKLYQFNTDHAAGAWDSTDVVEANVTDQVVSNAAAIAGLTASDVAYVNTDSGLSATNVQGALDELRQADNIMMSDGVTSVEDKLEDKATVTLSATNCTLEATVKNGILFIYFEIMPSTANTWVSPFSDALPAGYRPNRSLYVTAISSDLKVASVYIKNDGTIQIKGASTGTFTGFASYYI